MRQVVIVNSLFLTGEWLGHGIKEADRKYVQAMFSLLTTQGFHGLSRPHGSLALRRYSYSSSSSLVGTKAIGDSCAADGVQGEASTLTKSQSRVDG